MNKIFGWVYNMNKKLFKKLSLVITIIIMLAVCFVFTSCKKSKYDRLISYSFSNNPKNLDPQTAYESEEITLINNIFEGLYKKNLNNKYELGVAENVSESDNGKKLTFTIKNNVFWHFPKEEKNVKVKADDFVFAFKRLINRETNSPYASNYFFIKNAQKINEGKMSIKSLGVYKNEKNQLVIELENKTPFLKELLAQSAAMPCNKNFFESTKGRYGTSKETIISNGPFYLNTWNNEKNTTKFRIRQNDKYLLKDLVKIIGVNFSVKTPEESFNLLKNNDINSAIVSSSQFNNLPKNQFKSIPFHNKVNGIIFNEKNNFLGKVKIHTALSFSVNRDKLEDKLTSNQSIANNLIPNFITITGKPYNKLKKWNCCPQYDPEQAKSMFESKKEEIKKTDKKFDINSFSILTKDSSNAVLNQLLQIWQKDLNLFLKIDNQNEEQYNKKLENGQFDCALVSINSSYNSPASILKNFTKNSPFNYSKYEIKKFDEELNSVATQNDIETITEKYRELEETIVKYGYFIPLTFETEYFVTDKKFKDIMFTPSSKQFYYAYCHSD